MNIDSTQMAVQNEASTAVLAKSLDAAKAQGDQVVSLLASAAPSVTGAQGPAITDPAIGGLIDISV